MQTWILHSNELAWLTMVSGLPEGVTAQAQVRLFPLLEHLAYVGAGQPYHGLNGIKLAWSLIHPGLSSPVYADPQVAVQ